MDRDSLLCRDQSCVNETFGEQGSGSLLNRTAKVNNCTYIGPDWLEEKFYLVVVFGTSLAVISTLENCFLFYILSSRPRFRNSSLFYLGILAFFDVFFSLSYVFLMTGQVLYDYLPSLRLATAWHSYLRPVFAVSHVTMAAATFLIIAATVERFVTLKKCGIFSHVTRVCVTLVAVGFGLLMKFSVYFEIAVKENPNCTNLARFRVDPSGITEDPFLNTLWSFYIRNIMTVFLPFAILGCFNFLIVYTMGRQQKQWVREGGRKMSRRTLVRVQDEARRELGRATRMLMVVVSMHLVTNVPNLLVTVWENVDQHNLMANHFKFYTFSADTTSILFVLASALRLPIYVWCNVEIREELNCFFRNILCLRKDKETGRIRHRLGIALTTLELRPLLLQRRTPTPTTDRRENGLVTPECGNSNVSANGCSVEEGCVKTGRRGTTSLSPICATITEDNGHSVLLTPHSHTLNKNTRSQSNFF